jgi:hypothetical protein
VAICGGGSASVAARRLEGKGVCVCVCVCVCRGEEGTMSMAGQHERPKFKAAQNSTK